MPTTWTEGHSAADRVGLPAGSAAVPHSRVRWAMLGLGAVVALWATLALPARATYDARTTADEPQYLLTALSLAEDFDLDISDEIDERRFEEFHEVSLDPQTEQLEGGGELSPHDPLLPVLLAPGMALGGWVGAKLTLAILSGLLAAAMLWTAVRRFGVDLVPAVLVVGAFALAAPLTSYGTQVYPELPAALLVTLGVALATSVLAPRHLVGLAAVVAAMPWLAVKYVPVAAALLVVGGWRLWRSGRHREFATVLGALGLAGLAYLGVHQAVYGGWTVYAAGDHFGSTGEFSVVGVDPDYLGRTSRLVGLVVDRGFGLAAWAPVWLFAVPALGALVRRRPPGWDVLVLPLVSGWLTATFLALTMHGWWWPGRQVVVVLPCLVLATAWWVGRAKPVLPWLVGAAAVGMLAWGWLVIEVLRDDLRLIVDFIETSNPLYRGWRTLLPDARAGGAGAEWGRWLWTVALAVLAWLGWRSVDADEDARAGELTDTDVTSVDLDRGRSVG